MLENRKKFLGEAAFVLLVFFVMLAFFSEVHPMVMYDGDDWNGLSKQRNIAFPKWHDHNPIKVLPESLMPLAAPIAAYVVLPFLGDFLTSVTLVSAGILSALISLYLYLFLKVMEKRFALETWAACLLGLMFLSFHFLIFKHGEYGNPYLFEAMNLTCYYHYTIPALWNICILLYFLWKGIPGTRRIEGRKWQDCLLVFLLYLGICSSVLHSIIFMAYICIEFLWNLGKWREQRLLSGLLAVWTVTLLFEGLGGRAGQMGQSLLDMPVTQTFLSLSHVLFQNNKGIWIALVFAVIFVGCSIFIYRRRREKDAVDVLYVEGQKKFLACALLWTVYEVLVCARAGGGYIDLPEVTIGLFFYLFFLMFSAAAYVFHRKPGASVVLPILAFIVVCRTISAQQSLLDSTMGRVPPAICAEVSRDIIRQVQAAEKAGMRKMELHVPKGDDHDNWPHPNYMGPAVSRLLYGQGLIPYPMEITIVPDPAMNQKYGIR